ncbi:endospore germination permease [Bacillus sp. 31A1R]|uniref:Endospore germination permease n=1 Tax=Robertmurraya mangrovi TaxID=3098077 RepID=A0ABU5IWN9_9BACI|nr:endospore germination permease [Bacillus sp. 31A1R]MDZ5471583.1 endospore germination permease [Bacillus sp. 31A1R]
MIKPTDRKVGTREFVAIILLSMGIKFTDMTPTLLYKETANAAWMVPILSGLIMFVPLLFLLKLLKFYKDKNLIEIIFSLTGKYVGFLLGMCLFLSSYSSTVTNSRSYVDIISTMFFPNTNIIVLFLLLIGSSYYLANRGLNTIANTAWISLPYIKAFMVIGILMVTNQVNFNYIFPIGGYGALTIIKNSISYSSIFADIMFFSVVFPFFKNYESFRKASLIGYALVIFELVMFLTIYIMYFDFPGIENITYPFQEITRAVRLGRFITNIEAVFLGFWSVASIIRFSIYLYISTAIFAYSLKLKEFEPLLLPFGLLVILLGYLPENFIINSFQIRGPFVLNMTSGFIFSLPILLWSIHKIRGER